MASFNSVNTKLEALKLIHDPVKLLSLLFSKYGDIEEDYNLLYIDQLVYNKSSHYNILFKEFKYYNMDEENLKRYYFEDESKNRLPKLSEYYKNYHMFFCKPILKNFQFGEILHNNDDNKAEIFYKKNYCTNKSTESVNKKDTSLSSLDNLTNNKTIFDKKTIGFIEDTNNIDNITITLDNSKILNCNLLSKRSKNDSFQNLIREIVSYNSNKNTNPKTTIKNKEKKDTIKLNKNIQKTRISKIKSSLYSIMKPQFNSGTRDNSKNKTITPTDFKHYLSNLEEFNKNKIISKSNFSNFTKLSSVLSNTSNKNSIKNSKYSIRTQMKNKDSFNQTNKNNYNNISAGTNPKYSLLIGNMLHSQKINNTIQKNKNKSQQKNENNNNINNVIFCKKKIKNNTFDSNQVYNSNYISKLNSNSNFSTFNANSNYSSNKKLTKGSNFNLVKSPLTNILKGKTINTPSLLNDRKISTIVSQKSVLRKGNFHISSSNSLSKYVNNNKKNKIFKHFDNSNIPNFIFSSQRSTSDTSNLNILQNNINNKDIIKISRNKINCIISQTKSYKKNITNRLSSNHTKSMEEFNKIKNKYRNVNTHRLLEKIEVQHRVHVDKKPFSNKNWNKTIEVSYSKNDSNKNNSKQILEKSIKPINVNLNKNLLLSAERKNKVNSKISNE